MAVPEQIRVTLEEFDEYINRPENADRLFEYIGGEIVEAVANNYSSEIAATILAEVKAFAKANNLGRVTGADGGYIVSGEKYIPDVAFISFARQPEPSHNAYNPNAPDLAVEVLSPGNTEEQMLVKVANYLAAGTVVWRVKPLEKQVVVLVPGKPAKTLTINDTLDGGDVLPGFKLAVREIFPE
jgi:Uma2 family endonuclease